MLALINKFGNLATIQLTLAQVIQLGFNFISSIIIANSLGVEKFGNFVFYFSIVNIILLFFRFGYFSSVGVLVVQTNNKRRQSELIGAGFVIAILIGLGYSLFLVFVSDYIDEFFKSNIKKYILETLPFLVFIPLTMYINQVVQAINDYKPLIIYNLLSAFISLVIVLFLYFANRMSIEYLILAKIVPMSIVILAVFVIFKMSFSNLLKNLRLINLKNRKHGFHLYLGQISDQFVYKSDELMIKYFTGSSELGLYKIAQQLTTPFGMLAKNYAFSKFKVVANASFIPSKLQRKLFLISIFSMVASITFSYIVINYFYIDEYRFAFWIALILSLALFFDSLNKNYNNFINGHSMGKLSMRASIYMAIANFILNILIIPYLYAIGAALSSLISICIYNIYILKAYKGLVRL